MAHRSRTYRRAELYEQVWAAPMRTVAAQYGVSDVALSKICKKLKVPVPGRGHWNKLQAGHEVIRVPLPPHEKGAPMEIHVSRWEPERGEPVVLPPAVQARVDAEKDPAAAIVVPRKLDDEAHKLVRVSRRALAKYKPTAQDPLIHSWSEWCLDVHVSPASLDRALRIMDALLKALEARKLRIEVTPIPSPDQRFVPNASKDPPNRTRVLVDGEWIYFGLNERCTLSEPREQTPPEGLKGRALESWRSWHKPRRDRVPSGDLVLELGDKGHVWKETPKRRLDECLNDVVATLHIVANHRKEARAAAERRARDEASAAERRWEAERQAAAEKKREGEFAELLARWRFARDVRDYLSDVRAIVAAGGCVVTPDEELHRSLAWAASLADRIDPLSDLRRDVAAARAQAAGENPAEGS